VIRGLEYLTREQLVDLVEELEDSIPFETEDNCRRCGRLGFVNADGYCSSARENGFVAPGQQAPSLFGRT